LGDNDRIGSPAALATAVIALIGAKTSDLGNDRFKTKG
jgi:hypothetical protein